jgi:hypothetical protein
LQDEISSGVVQIDNFFTKLRLALVAKIDRDIKLTEKFSDCVSRKASKGVRQVAEAVEAIGK